MLAQAQSIGTDRSRFEPEMPSEPALALIGTCWKLILEKKVPLVARLFLLTVVSMRLAQGEGMR